MDLSTMDREGSRSDSSLSSGMLDMNFPKPNGGRSSSSDDEYSGLSDSSISISSGVLTFEDTENQPRGFAKDMEGRVLARMEIPWVEHRILIGPQGENVKKLKSDTGCIVTFPALDNNVNGRPQASHMNEVAVRGKLANTVEALQKLRDSIPFTFFYCIPQQVLIDHPEIAGGDTVFEQIKQIFPVDVSFQLSSSGKFLIIVIRGPQKARTLFGAQSIVDYFMQLYPDHMKVGDDWQKVTTILTVHPHSQSSMYALCDADAMMDAITQATRVDIGFPNPRANAGDTQSMKIKGCSVKEVAAGWLQLMSMLPVTIRMFVEKNVCTTGLADFIQNQLAVNVLAPTGAPRGERKYVELKSIEDNLSNICLAHEYVLTRSVQPLKFNVRRLADKFQELQIADLLVVPANMGMHPTQMFPPVFPYMPMAGPLMAPPMFGCPYPMMPFLGPVGLPVPFPPYTYPNPYQPFMAPNAMMTGEMSMPRHEVKMPSRPHQAKRHYGRAATNSVPSSEFSNYTYGRKNARSTVKMESNLDLDMNYEKALLTFAHNGSPKKLDDVGDMLSGWNFETSSSLFKEINGNNRGDREGLSTGMFTSRSSVTTEYSCTEITSCAKFVADQPFSAGTSRGQTVRASADGWSVRNERNLMPKREQQKANNSNTDWGFWNTGAGESANRGRERYTTDAGFRPVIHNFDVGHWN